MQNADYVVLLIYLAGIFAVGVGLSLRVKNTGDLFAAGGRSPWWASGLSGFMTMFSAGTFVVWGGIAYRLGLVAVMINLCYGVSAILVGYTLAGRWKSLGIRTPAEFVEKRFGRSALHFYTWTMMVYRMVSTGVALYSLAVLLVTLMPLGAGNPLRDAATGNLSLTWAVLIFGGCVVIYTMVGGLWAVLITDVLQFIVLNLAVLVMVPLILSDVGGVSALVAKAPEGFFYPTAGNYTWFFLAGWCAIHFFMVGAEWAFVQRFICVPTQRDARKSAYLFGGLYLISPILWLLPPLTYRMIHPIPAGATEEEIIQLAESAYIMACNHVLPVGMVGLMLAAMFSATASMVSSQLNVFAGVVTEDLYHRLIGGSASDRHLLWAGRVISLLLGAALVGLALLIPRLGGAEKVVIAITAVMVTPLLAPTVWGVLSPRIRPIALWFTTLTCVGAGLLAKYQFADELARFGKAPDVLLGVVLPVALLFMFWLAAGKGTVSVGWTRAMAARQIEIGRASGPAAKPDPAPAYIVAGALAVCAVITASLLMVNEKDHAVLIAFAAILAVIAAAITAGARRRSRRLNA